LVKKKNQKMNQKKKRKKDAPKHDQLARIQCQERGVSRLYIDKYLE